MSLTEHHYQGLDWSCESINKRLESLESILAKERDEFGEKLKAAHESRDAYEMEVRRQKEQICKNHEYSPGVSGCKECLWDDRALWKSKAEQLADSLADLLSWQSLAPITIVDQCKEALSEFEGKEK